MPVLAASGKLSLPYLLPETYHALNGTVGQNQGNTGIDGMDEQEPRIKLMPEPCSAVIDRCM